METTRHNGIGKAKITANGNQTFSWFFFYAFAFAGLIGCTDLTPYRSKEIEVSAGFVHERRDGFTSNPMVVSNSPIAGSHATNYILATIEFDDQGEMWDRNELTECMGQIEAVESLGHPVTLIVFVHGWNNDASDDKDNNLKDFREFIQGFAKVERHPMAGKKPRYIVGAYLAWRGKSAKWLVPQIFTFWSRKNAAERVAGIPCTEAILSLMAKTKPANGTVSSDSKVIIVGHSFGGLIVERAVTQAMLGSMLLNGPTNLAKLRIAETNIFKDKQIIDSITQNLETNGCRIVLNHPSKENYVASFTTSERDALDKAVQKYDRKQSDLLAKEQLLSEFLQGPRKDCLSNYRMNSTAAINDLLGDSQKEDYKAGILYKLALSVTNEFKINSIFTNLDWNLIEKDREVIKVHQNVSKIKQLEELNASAITLQSNLVQLHFEITNGAALKSNSKIWESRFTENLQPLNDLKKQILACSNLMSQCISDSNELIDLQKETNLLWIAWQTKTNESEKKWDECSQKNSQYNAAMADMAKNERAKKAIVDPSRAPADLIILLNPAVEALATKSMIEAMQNNELIQIDAGRRPWIVSISSHGGLFAGLASVVIKTPSQPGDWLTDQVFPFGRTFSATFKQFRDYTNFVYATRPLSVPPWPWELKPQDHLPEQRKYFLHTAPQLPEFCNWELKSTNSPNPLFGSTNKAKIITVNTTLTNFYHDLTFGFYTTTQSNQIQILREKKGAGTVNNSGYWVISVPREIIPNHGNIFQPNIIALTAALYRLSQTADVSP